MINSYRLFSLPEFEATGLASRTFQAELEGLGLRSILISRGNETSIMYEDAFLPVSFLGENPYQQGDKLVWLDDENWVWLGIEVEDQ